MARLQRAYSNRSECDWVPGGRDRGSRYDMHVECGRDAYMSEYWADHMQRRGLQREAELLCGFLTGLDIASDSAGEFIVSLALLSKDEADNRRSSVPVVILSSRRFCYKL